MQRIAIGFGFLIAGCGYPAFGATMRSNFSADTQLEGKCVQVYRDDVGKALQEQYAQGWRLAYASEYTSSMRFNENVVFCFERASGLSVAITAPATGKK